MTDEEMTAAAAESQKMIDLLKGEINHLKSPDMDTEKILGRVGIVSAMGGMTRTTVLGSAVYAGLYAPIVGLTEDQVVEAVRAGFKASQGNPLTQKLAEQYLTVNTEFHEKKALEGKANAPFMVKGDLSKVN